MLKSINFIIALFIVLAVNAQNVESQVQMSLEECIDYALQHNEMLLNKSLDRTIAKAKVGEIRGQGFPQVKVEGNVTNNFEVATSLLDVSNFDATLPEGTEAPVQFGQAYSSGANVSLEQLIFNGSYFVGLKAARTFRELSAKEHVKTEIDVIESVTKAYYGALVNNERFKLELSNVNRLDSLLYETTVLFENGFAEKIDYSRVKVQYNNAKVARTSSYEILKLSYGLLKFQMGMPILQNLELKGQIQDAENELFNDAPLDFHYSDRIEYSQLQTNQTLTELGMKNIKVQRIPTVNAFANYGYNTSTDNSSLLFDFEDRWFSNGALGVRFSMPIFDGLIKKYKIEQSKTQLEQIQNSFALLKNTIDFEIATANGTMFYNRENMRAQKENMELAKEVYDVTLIKYQEGVGSNSDVLDADVSYKQALANYYNSLYDGLIAKIDLEKAYGTLRTKQN